MLLLSIRAFTKAFTMQQQAAPRSHVCCAALLPPRHGRPCIRYAPWCR